MHYAAIVEQVVAGQLLAQRVVVLAHGALEPGAYVLLGDGDGGEGLDFLFICRWGARVFKLIEELCEGVQAVSTCPFHYVSQAVLQLLTSGDPSALASQSAGIIGINHHTWPAS